MVLFMVKVSIILPVYNVEKYLNECLDSIVNQTFKDMEIICINDGSTDHSLAILNSYASRDERIKIISQENAGLGAARNVGLKAAEGDYIFFIDSDDFLYLDAIEELYENAVVNDSDVVLFRYTREYDIDRENNNYGYNLDDIFNMHGDDYKEFTFNRKDLKHYVLNMYLAVWMKFYKREFLNQYDDFYFTEGIAYEDGLFHVKIFLRAERMSHIPKIYYHYRQNPESIMNNSSYNMDIFKVVDSVEEFLIDNDYYGEFKDNFDFYKIVQISAYLFSSGIEDYFQKAREEFLKINLSPKHIVPDICMNYYNLVLDSNNYVEFLNNYYNKELERKDLEIKNANIQKGNLQKENKKLKGKVNSLKKSNKKLESENSKLQKTNSLMVTSTSWKITKPLRQLVYFFKKHL